MSTVEGNRFLQTLTPVEGDRVIKVVSFLDQYKVVQGDWLWVIGTGSIARGDPDARDIDIAVWIKHHQRNGLRLHLRRSLEEASIDHVIESTTGFFGIPRFVGKEERFTSSSGRAIELTIATLAGDLGPEFIMDIHRDKAKIPIYEFILKMP